MKKRRMGVLLLSSALILSGVTFGVVSCGEGTQQTTENPQITLALDVSEIYVGQTAKVTATVNGSAVTGVEYSIVEGGEKVASVASDGTVTGLSAGKATIKARKAGHKAGTVEITVANRPVIEPDAVLEFEDAEHVPPAGGWTDGTGNPVETPVEQTDTASGGASLGYQSQGVVANVKFTAEEAGTVDLGFVMATTAMDWTSFQMTAMTVKDVITIEVNNTELDLTGITLEPGEGAWNYYAWNEFIIDDVSIKAGNNVITVTTVGMQGPNMDCIKVYGDLGIEQTKVEAVTTENIGTYTYYVNGYEWGPGVYKVVVDFGTGNAVAASDLAIDLFQVNASGAGGAGAREVKDIYLVDANGDEDTAATSGTRVGMELGFNITSQNWGGWIMTSTNGASPFQYVNETGKNIWDASYTITTRLAAGKSLKIGETTYDATEKPFVCNAEAENGRVITAVKDWGEQKSYTNEDNNQTLTYKAYETTAMAEDGVKNPLIIWLHGAGEGGTDVDIALLGNDVTNLGEEKIQSYFKTNGSAGAYVLAVQTPTMWMDAGEGTQTEGTSSSIYTETLMKTIEAYVTGNEDVDPNRIYLGGCSNGGFMTMEMAIKYNSYFAAYYPICEAKADSAITDENIALLKDSNIWFTHAANDTTVAPDNFTNATYKRLIDAKAQNVYYSYFENVVGDDSGTEVEYMGHYSWIYALKDQCDTTVADANNITAPSTEKVMVGSEEVTLWGWLASTSK